MAGWLQQGPVKGFSLPKISEHAPTTFAQVLRLVETFQNNRSVSWYRGTGDATHTLTPTLSRHVPALTPEELARTEREIANRFIQRSPPFVQGTFADEWKLLFYMQHYGIPTRLLDWSESPFVGLYFALTSVKRDEAGIPQTDAAVWLCDPVL